MQHSKDALCTVRFVAFGRNGLKSVALMTFQSVRKDALRGLDCLLKTLNVELFVVVFDKIQF